ncbi:hypothetical protein [Pseudonocardia sp. N23]|uniref:hypothetical protein n=1 Tax=Pseudonocardia sp. N23 TaxID=1987376 RepID=UPI000BFC7154|nr:hypothetical protein [Pseudonocardia sp. N23]GAY10273.1 hypothetical protein TOK_4632 [Pseudonocardia sp. N23]
MTCLSGPAADQHVHQDPRLSGGRTALDPVSGDLAAPAVTGLVAVVGERVAGVHAVVDAAAAGDPAIAELAREIDRRRRVVAAWVVDGLARCASTGTRPSTPPPCFSTPWCTAGSPGWHAAVRRRRAAPAAAPARPRAGAAGLRRAPPRHSRRPP